MQGRGFIEAGSLFVGDKLVNVNGEDLFIEDYSIELTEEPIQVYNFQVEDFHTYFVGDCEVWVHNVDCRGANGTQTSSKTTWKNGKTERLDVENPSPGHREGNIHNHDANNKKYYYDIDIKNFYNAKTGAAAPTSVQKLLKNDNFLNGIKKALRILGE